MTAAASRPADGELVVALPDDYGCACVLLLLQEQPSSGHELGERLRPLGLGEPEGLPRTLRRLEWVGLVRAAGGDGDGSGTTYHLTPAGAERLGAVAVDLRATCALLGWFLARCGERLVHERSLRSAL